LHDGILELVITHPPTSSCIWETQQCTFRCLGCSRWFTLTCDYFHLC